MNWSRERASRPSVAAASTSAIRMASGRAPGAYEEVAGVEIVIGAGVVRAVAGSRAGVLGGTAGVRTGVVGAKAGVKAGVRAGVRAGVGGRALGVKMRVGRALESETGRGPETESGRDAVAKTAIEDIEAGRRAGVKTRGAVTKRGGRAPEGDKEAVPGARAGGNDPKAGKEDETRAEREAGEEARAWREARRAPSSSTRRCRSSLRRWEASSSLSRSRAGAETGLSIAEGRSSRRRRGGLVAQNEANRAV
jgi:hypothetical protein